MALTTEEMIRGGKSAKVVSRAAQKEGDSDRAGTWKKAAHEWGKEASKSHAKKKELAKKISKEGFDSNKHWGNSAMKGHGVNSPAMMEARKNNGK